jgi:ABC-type uncharacterized transport system ATPase subunit
MPRGRRAPLRGGKEVKEVRGDSMDILEVNRLTKKYGDLTAVDGTSFSVQEGEVFGFLGPTVEALWTEIYFL